MASGEGIALTVSFYIPATLLVSNVLGCVMSWIGTPPAAIYIPVTPGSASAGTAAFYEIWMNSSTVPDTTMIVGVNGTAATPWATWACLPGIALPGEFSSFQGDLPGAYAPTIDSTTAVSYANLAGGTAFLTQHTSASKSWAAIDGSPSLGAVIGGSVEYSPSFWLVEYSASCGAGSTGTTDFGATIDGASGAVLNNQTSACQPSGTYPVTFSETGLPVGAQWSVGLLGIQNTSTRSTIGFSVANGTYTYYVETVAGYAPIVPTGQVTVQGGPTTVNVTYTAAPTRAITFSESGLPTGTDWQVYLGAFYRENSSTQLDPFYVTPGSYNFTVTAVGSENASPASGTVAISTIPASISIVFSALTTYPVTFTETGLPRGSVWAVLAYGGTGTVVAFRGLSGSTTMSASLPNRSYFSLVGSVSPYYVPSPPYGVFTVNGTGANVSYSFVAQAAYTVTFNETGLAPGTPWFALLGGISYNSSASATSLTFGVPAGNYTFTAGGAPGYTPSPANGTLQVSTTSVFETITFRGSGTTSMNYGLSFVESGLPTATQWSVTLGAGSPLTSTSTTIGFVEPDGMYPYTVGAVAGYTASPARGSATVNGAASRVQINFTASGSSTGRYNVTFQESGLVSGTNWSVTLGSNTLHSTNSSILFSESNGAYLYTIANVGRETPTPASGSVTVNGAGQTESIQFRSASGAPPTYSVTFTESGLPNGTSWSLSLNGTSRSSTSTTITFTETDGTYTFTVGSVSGYSASPSFGPLTVSGQNVTRSIAFTSSGSSNQAGFLGLSGNTGYYLVGGIIVVIAALGVGVASRFRRRGPPANPSLQDSKNIADGASKSQAIE